MTISSAKRELAQTNPEVSKTAALAIILVSYIMIVLDISIVLTGLPKIKIAFDFSDAGLAWVSSIYTLTFGGFLLLGARAGDLLGHRRMLVFGLALFSIASLFIGLAQSAGGIVVARAVQGVGSAILAPTTLALLQINFPAGPQRSRAVAYYAASAGVAASFGLVLGGVFADMISWRVGFLINAPIGIALIAASLRCFNESEKRIGNFDFWGALSSYVGMSALVFAAIRSAETGLTEGVTLLLLGIGIVLLMVFLLIERRARHPILPLHLFAHRQRATAYAARFLVLGANVSFFFFITQFMQGVMGFSAMQAGFGFLPAMVVNFCVAMTVPMLAKRLGNGPVLAASVTTGLLGMAWLSRLSGDASYLPNLALPMIMVGAGQGGSLAPLTNFGIADVPSAEAGAASGAVSAAHQLGSSLGLAALVAVAAVGNAGYDGAALLTHRMDNAMTGATAMMLVALILVLALLVRPRAASAQP